MFFGCVDAVSGPEFSCFVGRTGWRGASRVGSCGGSRESRGTYTCQRMFDDDGCEAYQAQVGERTFAF
jgi:hypothetical protein